MYLWLKRPRGGWSQSFFIGSLCKRVVSQAITEYSLDILSHMWLIVEFLRRQTSLTTCSQGKLWSSTVIG